MSKQAILASELSRHCFIGLVKIDALEKSRLFLLPSPN